MRFARIAIATATAGAMTSALAASVAWGAVTPGWECIPTTAGQAVVSGGTGAAPSCGAGSTAVLAPTFISSGVGGKPTVQFSAVNVQVVSGSGSTDGALNGEGNLVVGYGENPSGFSQTGSNDLVVGSGNGWTGYGGIVGGNGNQATGNYATAVGQSNTASGIGSLVAGLDNAASGGRSSITGGAHNQARAAESSIAGGDFNLARGSFASVLGGCKNLAGTGNLLNGNCASGAQAVLGGLENTASGLESTVSGGESNTASGTSASVLGGDSNNASSNCQVIPAAPGSC